MSEVYTPSDLAKRWKCSEDDVWKRIREGKLRAFYPAPKKPRIRQAAVEAYEGGEPCTTIDLADLKAASLSSGTKAESAAAIALARATQKKQEQPFKNLSAKEYIELLAGKNDP